MDYLKHLAAAGVPATLYGTAAAALDQARERIKGLTLAKWRVRLFRAGEISRLLPWSAERLIDVRPDLAAWDIAPMVNITAHGDNAPWQETPQGGRPVPGRWLNPDPTSDEYRQAVAANYWCPGEHPRSAKSRKAWYRRNAGEYAAWARGMPIDLSAGVQVWRGNGVTVRRCGDAWQIVAAWKLLGLVPMVTRIGYELDNVWVERTGEQAWYPLPGFELRATVTWSVLPGRAPNA